MGLIKLSLSVAVSTSLLFGLSACDKKKSAEQAKEVPLAGPEGAALQAPDPANTMAGHGGGHSLLVNAGGLTWDDPPSFVRRLPTNPIRKAEYAVKLEPGEKPATLAIHYFGEGTGGSATANVVRWIDQFRQPDGSRSQDAAKVSTKQIRGMNTTFVDLKGIYVGMNIPDAPAAPERPNQRLLGAIVEGDLGPVFFKLTGDIATVNKGEAGFFSLVESVRKLTDKERKEVGPDTPPPGDMFGGGH